MKYILLVLTLGFSLSVFAKFNVKPGLWKFDAEIEAAGIKVNAHAALEAVMGQLSEEQKKEIMKAGGGQLPEFSGEKSQICITQKMIDDGSLQPDQESDCKPTMTINTSSKIAGTFKCKNGASGTIDWSAKSTTAFDGVVNVKNADGKTAKMTYKAAFLKDKCKN